MCLIDLQMTETKSAAIPRHCVCNSPYAQPEMARRIEFFLRTLYADEQCADKQTAASGATGVLSLVM